MALGDGRSGVVSTPLDVTQFNGQALKIGGGLLRLLNFKKRLRLGGTALAGVSSKTAAMEVAYMEVSKMVV